MVKLNPPSNHPCIFLAHWLVNKDFQAREKILTISLENDRYKGSLYHHFKLYGLKMGLSDNEMLREAVHISMINCTKPSTVKSFIFNCSCKDSAICPIAQGIIPNVAQMLYEKYGAIKNDARKRFQGNKPSESFVRFCLNIAQYQFLKARKKKEGEMYEIKFI